jgi:two-component system sensor histidine kinase PilS (NtrC family)
MNDDTPVSSWHPFSTRIYSDPTSENLWRSLYLFNLYRLVLSLLFVFLAENFGDTLPLDTYNLPLFLHTGYVYTGLTLASLLAIQFRRPAFNLQLALQVGSDIACLTVLTYAGGGVRSGFGMLLLVTLAAAGLISRGRITLLYAALASIAVLLQHTYAVLNDEADVAQYIQTGLLSGACFAVAWLAHALARNVISSEMLAARRGVDLANMAEANRLVMHDAPDGILVVDASGLVKQSNPSAEHLLGYAYSAGKEVHLRDCSPLLAERYAAWLTDQADDHRELRLPVTNYRVRVHFLPVRRDGFWGAVLFLEDIQRSQAQAQQIKLAALGRLTMNIAHEVRNPLSSISYATELLQEEKHDPAQDRLIRIILDNASRLDRIVRDVMQLNRRDRGQMEQLRLADVLPAFVTELCQSEHARRDIFSLEVDPECAIGFDRGHLDQVLWNVCCNALRYCRKQAGSIRLHAWSSADRRNTLEIIDDGPGIDADAVQHLFEPFFTTAAGGTGLGLYIARELCEANGAGLEYVQKQAGGACFRIGFQEN